MIPIEKNIIVIDEQGNEYEATYPKRAKEQSIIASEEKTLTIKDIFNQICLLQQELTNNSYQSLHRLSDTIDSICDGDNEDKTEQIAEACNVFGMREAALAKMLEFYQKMYEDIANKELKKATLIKEAFSEHSHNVTENECMTPEENLIAVNYITDKIAECIKIACDI